MEPIGVEQKGQDYRIIHRCIKCGEERKNKIAVGDDFEAVLARVKKSFKGKN